MLALKLRWQKHPRLRKAVPVMKIDPYHYPVILIAAFVLGMVLAMLLGFRPEHGERVNELLPFVLLML
jgi:hypothetical protein